MTRPLYATKDRYRAGRKWGECFDDWFDRVVAEQDALRRPENRLVRRVKLFRALRPHKMPDHRSCERTGGPGGH
jgi:hypothetical protein